MKIKINSQKFAEAIEGFNNQRTISLKERYPSENEAEEGTYSRLKGIKNSLYKLLKRSNSKTSLDEIFLLNDFGKIDLDDSKFYGMNELLNAKIILSVYGAKNTLEQYKGVINCRYKDELKHFIEGPLDIIEEKINYTLERY